MDLFEKDIRNLSPPKLKPYVVFFECLNIEIALYQ